MEVNKIYHMDCLEGLKVLNKLGHTTPFPEDIPEMAIKFYSAVGDIVFDMLAGSGTIQAVAKRLNRKYLGFEKQSEYDEIANKRINGKRY